MRVSALPLPGYVRLGTLPSRPLFPQLYSGIIGLLAGLTELAHTCKGIRVEGVWLTEYLTTASYTAMEEEYW